MCAADDLGEHGIRVNAVMPGIVPTPIWGGGADGGPIVDEYLALTAIANPHVQITYFPPDLAKRAEPTVYERATKQRPEQPKEIKPHPHGIELGIHIGHAACDTKAAEETVSEDIEWQMHRCLGAIDITTVGVHRLIYHIRHGAAGGVVYDSCQIKNFTPLTRSNETVQLLVEQTKGIGSPAFRIPLQGHVVIICPIGIEVRIAGSAVLVTLLTSARIIEI